MHSCVNRKPLLAGECSLDEFLQGRSGGSWWDWWVLMWFVTAHAGLSVVLALSKAGHRECHSPCSLCPWAEPQLQDAVGAPVHGQCPCATLALLPAASLSALPAGLSLTSEIDKGGKGGAQPAQTLLVPVSTPEGWSRRKGSRYHSCELLFWLLGAVNVHLCGSVRKTRFHMFSVWRMGCAPAEIWCGSLGAWWEQSVLLLWDKTQRCFWGVSMYCCLLWNPEMCLEPLTWAEEEQQRAQEAQGPLRAALLSRQLCRNCPCPPCHSDLYGLFWVWGVPAREC